MVKGKKQVALKDDTIKRWAQLPEIETEYPFCLPGWKRNQQLIDFSYIPTTVRDAVRDTYVQTPVGKRSALLGYFIKHHVQSMVQCVGDF
jgi:hypothetical protein